MNKYDSEEDRQAAVERGETSRRNSTLQDGRKHYAIMRDDADGVFQVHRNLTGTDKDNLEAAEELAHKWDFGPYPKGVEAYYAGRIS